MRVITKRTSCDAGDNFAKDGEQKKTGRQLASDSDRNDNNDRKDPADAR